MLRPCFGVSGIGTDRADSVAATSAGSFPGSSSSPATPSIRVVSHARSASSSSESLSTTGPRSSPHH
eukprot:7874110-Pyramimonas_sp.AAC.1